jgi:hypothetical protein
MERTSSDVISEIKFIKGYQFNVPLIHDDVWEFNCEIGFDFATSGSVGILLMPNSTTPTALCNESQGCSIGASDRLNFKSINSILGAGNYSLWIYDLVGLSNSQLAQCTPFSFKLKIAPLQKIESFLTCNAALLPTNFEAPGLVDSNSTRKYFLYTEEVLVSPSRNTARFTIHEKSYFRIWVEEHRIDLDIYLMNSNNDVLLYSLVKKNFFFSHFRI